VNGVLTQFRRKSGGKPPLSPVLAANVTTIALWTLIYNLAEGPIWLW
jgi:hypothetical protein